MGFFTNYDIELSILVATNTYAKLEEGIDNLTQAWNDVVQSYQFYADNGYGRTRVTGAAPSISVTGKRLIGDAAQDFICGHKAGFGSDRETTLKVAKKVSGVTTEVLTVPVTITNIVDWGGAPTDDGTFSCELHFNGKPTFANVCAIPVASPAAGAVESGSTVALSCATSGATIYYTTDGTAPTTSSSQYSSAISVTAAVTIRAIAVKAGFANSDIMEARYTISA